MTGDTWDKTTYYRQATGSISSGVIVTVFDSTSELAGIVLGNINAERR